MATVRVFDPAMCCSTGVCGTDVDPTLSRFAADLDWLTAQGADVQRMSLSQEPGAFVAVDAVRDVLETDGPAGLPAIVVDGVLTSKGRYPERAELAMWAGVRVDQAAQVPVMAAAPAARTALPIVAAAPAARTASPTAGGCCGGAGAAGAGCC